jgi:hypothetical protein
VDLHATRKEDFIDHRYSWGKPAGGLKFGLRTSSATIRVADATDLYGAVRNISGDTLSLNGNYTLVVHIGAELLEDRSGPRSSTPLLLAPGEMREFVSWRLSTQINQVAGKYICELVYYTSSAYPVRSGEVEIEVSRSSSAVP